ncbi:MAG: hypothetical protein LBU88_00340 [Treponema sp.]|jgi:hypothetical protein|nr:hypothetical protein [Treponema sp.]
MKRIKYCVRHEGKTYGYDEAYDRIVIVTIDDIELEECPKKVGKLMSLLRNEEKEETAMLQQQQAMAHQEAFLDQQEPKSAIEAMEEIMKDQGVK